MSSNTFPCPPFLENCTSIQISTDRRSSNLDIIQKPGLTSKGGIEGSFPIYDTSSSFVDGKKPRPLSTKDLQNLGDDKVVARVHIKCASRNDADFDVKVVAANGALIAQFKRGAGAALFGRGGKTVEMPVKVPILREGETPSDNQENIETMEFGTCTFQAAGFPRLLIHDYSTSYEMNIPSCNFHTAMCCLGFLLFLPTFGIGSCITLGLSNREPLKHHVQRIGGGGMKTDLNPLLVKKTNTLIDFNDLPSHIGGGGRPQDSSKTKFEILILSIITVCDNVVEPPSNASASA
eukprot:CAMPEP_0183314378 /NCGR_PEP_ID=MMETSP0160_2-20130417/48247_1 /TAXON_ID=2839 ORGANISM="Odontella Sinensis, Strain Grunow 1884" /NCGR_SAMPLE_ID=MMETSP0160_2 /ASSEMBLY_ACC=CAM_ASM_000250 /LENGTH=291 /DNA_ID=CAMNT_0025479693 /DNA_START=6 /DNA_END=881 /DNA_ORIENTATION=-